MKMLTIYFEVLILFLALKRAIKEMEALISVTDARPAAPAGRPAPGKPGLRKSSSPLEKGTPLQGVLFCSPLIYRRADRK
jgi:hypothetical protein